VPELTTIAPVVAAVVALAVYPQFLLARSERATTKPVLHPEISVIR
jgi:hypothetical protein